MTAKDYLSRPWELSRNIEKKERIVMRLRSSIGSFRGVTDMPRVPGSADGLGNTMARVMDLEEEIKGDKETLESVFAETRKAIDGVSDPEGREVLYLRHIEFKNWREITSILGYERSWVSRLYSRALHEISVPDEAVDSW